MESKRNRKRSHVDVVLDVVKDTDKNTCESKSAEEEPEEEYRCDKCDKKYTTLSNLNKHKKKHKRIQIKYPCAEKECNVVCSQAHTLTEHYRLKHNKDASAFTRSLGKHIPVKLNKSNRPKRVHKIIACECGMKIKSPYGFQRHVKNVHNPKASPEEINKYKVDLSEDELPEDPVPVPTVQKPHRQLIRKTSQRSATVVHPISKSPIQVSIAEPTTKSQQSKRKTERYSTVSHKPRRSARFEFQPSAELPDILFNEPELEPEYTLCLSTEKNERQKQIRIIEQAENWAKVQGTEQPQAKNSICSPSLSLSPKSTIGLDSGSETESASKLGMSPVMLLFEQDVESYLRWRAERKKPKIVKDLTGTTQIAPETATVPPEVAPEVANDESNIVVPIVEDIAEVVSLKSLVKSSAPEAQLNLNSSCDEEVEFIPTETESKTEAAVEMSTIKIVVEEMVDSSISEEVSIISDTSADVRPTREPIKKKRKLYTRTKPTNTTKDSITLPVKSKKKPASKRQRKPTGEIRNKIVYLEKIKQNVLRNDSIVESVSDNLKIFDNTDGHVRIDPLAITTNIEDLMVDTPIPTPISIPKSIPISNLISTPVSTPEQESANDERSRCHDKDCSLIQSTETVHNWKSLGNWKIPKLKSLEITGNTMSNVLQGVPSETRSEIPFG